MYYVYQYIDPRNNKPFYIGKGTGNRKFSHLLETLETTTNKRKYYKIKSIKKAGLEPIIEEVKTFKEETDAYDFEEELIKIYGRKGYDNNGILMNITLGSRPPDRTGRKLTIEQKEKLKGRKLTIEQKEKLKGRIPWNKGLTGLSSPWNKGLKGLLGKPCTEEIKEKLRKANLGKKKSSETKEKMSKNMKGRIPWNKGKTFSSSAKSIACVFISPNNEIYHFPSFRKGCIELKLPTDKISQVNKGHLPDYKGWTVKALNKNKEL